MKYKWSLKSLDEEDKIDAQKTSAGCRLPEYSKDVFVQYLVRWIVADDQVSVVLPHFVP